MATELTGEDVWHASEACVTKEEWAGGKKSSDLRIFLFSKRQECVIKHKVGSLAFSRSIHEDSNTSVPKHEGSAREACKQTLLKGTHGEA